MITTHDSGLVSAELLELTHSLGAPERDLVILAEGNTSESLGDGRMVVKASGTRMRDAASADFVVVETDPLIEILTSANSTQAQLTAALDAGVVDGVRRRGSIDALMHVSVQSMQPGAWVGHTHPTAVVALLSSIHAEVAFDKAAYSDEAVVLGLPLFVPHAQPGLGLGREFHRRVRSYADTHGHLPRLVTLGNHGIVAISSTPDGVDRVSDMAVKAAEVRNLAYSMGGVAPLEEGSVEELFAREDIAERREKMMD